MIDSSRNCSQLLKVVFHPLKLQRGGYVSISKEWTFPLSLEEHTAQLPMVLEMFTIYNI